MNTVLFFAQLQDQVGTERLEIEAAGLTVKDLKENLKQKYPPIQLEQVMTAVNEEYALNEDTIHSGDIIAFIPPVSGG